MSQADEFERLVRACQGELFAVILARIGQRESAKDLLQEVLLAAWRSRGTLLSLSADEGRRYLFAMARNRAIDHIRCTARERHSVVDLADRADLIASTLPSADDRLEMLDECINRLAVEDRELLMLSTIGEMDSQAIAHRLGSLPTTIRSRLTRIRQQVRNCIATKVERPSHVG